MFEAFDCLYIWGRNVLKQFNVSTSAERVVGVAGKQPVGALWEPLGVLSDETVLNQALLLSPVSPRDLPLARFPPVSQPQHSIKATLYHHPPPAVYARFGLTKQTTAIICLHKNALLISPLVLPAKPVSSDEMLFNHFSFYYEKRKRKRKGFDFWISYP